MALPPIKPTTKGKIPLHGLRDIENTHLNKQEIAISPPIKVDKNGFFFKINSDGLNELLDIKNYTITQANLEALPDDIVRKTDFEYQQGETIYMRMENDAPLQFLDSFDYQNTRRILPFMLIVSTIIYDEDKINFTKTPIYMLSNSLTKNNAYPMRRFYCVRNDYYINFFKGVS